MEYTSLAIMIIGLLLVSINIIIVPQAILCWILRDKDERRKR